MSTDTELVTSPGNVADAWARFVNRVEALVDYLPIIAIAIGVIAVFWLLASLVRRWEAPFRLISPSPLLRAVMQNITATVVFLVGVMITFELLNATKLIGAFLGAAGVVGLALGFAFKDIVENYLASILLALRRPFAAYDHVRIDDHEGKVMSLTTRETILMTSDGNHVRLSNAMVFKAVITNFTRNPKRRFSFGVGAGTEEDLTAAQKMGVDTLHAMPGVMETPPPFSLIENLGDSTVTIRFYGWVDQKSNDFSKVRSEAIRRVKTSLEDADIAMPEPTYRVALVGQARLEQEEKPEEPSRLKKTNRLATEKTVTDTTVDDHIDEQIRKENLEDKDNLLNKD